LDAIGADPNVPDLPCTFCDAINKYQQVVNKALEGLGTRLGVRLVCKQVIMCICVVSVVFVVFVVSGGLRRPFRVFTGFPEVFAGFLMCNCQKMNMDCLFEVLASPI